MRRAGRFRSAATCLGLLLTVSTVGGCGSGGLPSAFVGTWVVVLANADGWPQEDFAFDIVTNGTAFTAVRTVGTCSNAGVLSMSFSGWEGGDVSATVNLRADGTGTGTWQRAIITPGSGNATCTHASRTEFVGTYQLVYDGNAATLSTVQISREGLVIMGGLGIGVVGADGGIVIAIRAGAEAGAGPLVVTGTVTAEGGSGTYRLSTGASGTWAATRV